jgi:hypothetical protein
VMDVTPEYKPKTARAQTEAGRPGGSHLPP